MQLVLENQIGRLTVVQAEEAVDFPCAGQSGANLSIVPISSVGRVRYTSSSTVQTGRGESGSKRRHSSFSHRT